MNAPRKVISLILSAFLCAAISNAYAHGNNDPTAQTLRAGKLTLTVLYDNDLFGHLFPFAYSMPDAKGREDQSCGGAARRANLVRSIRSGTHNPVLLVDTGNVDSDGPLSTTYHGLADIDVMNAIGYDVAGVGSNDLSSTNTFAGKAVDAALEQPDLPQMAQHSDFPWVCANANPPDGQSAGTVAPYVVKVINGVRVGFLGLTAKDYSAGPPSGGWTISEPLDAARKWIPEARAHCDILIALTHVGMDTDLELAAQTCGIDAIIGGGSKTYSDREVDVTNPTGVKVPIVQDGEFGVDLGRLDIKINRDKAGEWRITGIKNQLIPVDSHQRDAKDVTAMLAPYMDPFNEVVGHIAQIAPSPDARLHQTEQIITDALRERTGADIALGPCNAELSGISDVFRHNAVTRYDVYSVLPMSDLVSVTTMKGTDIIAIVNDHPGIMIVGDSGGVGLDQSYKVAILSHDAVTYYHLPQAATQQTGLDVRDAVINFLGGS